ncbi:MAG: HEAT repeat domain-containing protein [Chloroflexota bacterium]
MTLFTDSERSVPDLVNAIESSDPEIVEAAEHALSALGKYAVDPLVKLLKTGTDKVTRRNAAMLLGALDSRRGLKGLTIAMFKDDDTEVRIKAVRAVREMCSRDVLPESLEVLIRCANQNRLMVQYAAIKALTQLDDRDALIAVQRIAAFHDTPRVRRSAEQALWQRRQRLI